MQPNDELDAIADEHRSWLSSFDSRYLQKWENLRDDNYEAAMTEASVRRMLQRNRVTVEPNERLHDDCGGPDFRCLVDGSHFYVEVTCILASTAERKIEIKDGRIGFSPINLMGMTEAIFAECKNKAPQCGNLDGHALVAIGTFHDTAARIGFKKVLLNTVLTGKTMMAWNIDVQSGQQVGDTYQTTELQAAAFLRPNMSQGVGSARSSISGVLLCRVALSSLQTIGVLHPDPARRFDPAHLPDIEFGLVELDRASSQLQVRWTKAGTSTSG